MNYKIIELTKENYNLYHPFNIIAFSHAIPGAMGESCSIIIVTEDGSVYHLNYKYDKWTKEDVLEICPIIKGGMFGYLKDISADWEIVYLGAGNFLFVNITIWEQFILQAEKYKYPHVLYRNWLTIIMNILLL